MFKKDEYALPIQRLIDAVDKNTAVNFAILCAERVLPLYETQFSEEKRVADGIAAAYQYLNNTIGVSQARKAAFASHSAARLAEKGSAARAAARCCGHTAATAHCKEHAIAAAAYAAIAIEIAEGSEGKLKEREMQHNTLLNLAERK
ncbi:MAG: hypothetical protein EOM87_00810 [Clostridia bacterium]|nr:hypothetical protein [Clostridia bacterium]